MLKLLSFLLLLASANAFWSSCNLPGVVTPDTIESPFCGATSCTIARGQTLLGNVWFTPARVHQRLDIHVTAFVLGVGIPLPIEPPYDNACDFFYHPTTGEPKRCPTIPGSRTRWEIVFPIPTTFPTFNNGRVRFELREHGVVEGCVDINSVFLT